MTRIRLRPSKAKHTPRNHSGVSVNMSPLVGEYPVQRTEEWKEADDRFVRALLREAHRLGLVRT